MPSDTLAGRLLELVTTRDRAIAIAGDFLEEASNRGRVWFWFSVFQTVAFHVLQDMLHRPGRMVWLALSGLAEMLLIATLLPNAVIKLWMAIWPYQYGPHTTYIPPWGFYGLLIAIVTTVPFFAGWDVARRSRGHELAAGAALIVLLAAMTAAGALIFGVHVRHYQQPYPYTKYPFSDFCTAGFCAMTGALVSRRRSSRIGTSA